MEKVETQGVRIIFMKPSIFMQNFLTCICACDNSLWTKSSNYHIY